MAYAHSSTVHKHYPESSTMTKGHFHCVKEGVCSTKEEENEIPKIKEATTNLANLQYKDCHIYVTMKDSAKMIEMGRTVCFPIVSSQEHKYRCVWLQLIATTLHSN